jgi:hypothetical protein
MIRAAAFVAGLAAFAAHGEVPRHIDAEYQITAAGLKIAQVVESFTREGPRYSIQSVTHPEGALKLLYDDTVTFHSEGSVGPGGLKPEKFTHRQSREKNHDVDATFDWARGLLVSTFRGETREVALPAETQDRLSLMYQFMNLSPGNAPMTVAMSNGRKVEQYQYRFVDEARITTPAGTFETLHYARVNTDPKESRADVWLARDRFNYPVRVVFDDPRGLKLEQSLVSLQAR